MVSRLAPAVREAPRLTTGAVVAFGAFGLACAWLLRRINYFRTLPAGTATLAWLWGGFAATGYALLANSAIRDYVAAAAGPDGGGLGDSWSLFAPLTEEPAKDVGILLVLLLAQTRPRTALDGLVAGSFVGLGFEVVECIARALNNAMTDYPPGQRDNMHSLGVDVLHEILRNSWTGHIVLTGIAGFGIGYLLTERDRSESIRWAVAGALVGLAFAGHLLWNAHRFGLLYVVGQFSLLVVYLCLVAVGRNRESDVYTPYLGYAPATVGPGEIESMRSVSARRAAATSAPDRQTKTRLRARQHAIAGLAAAIANGDAQRAHASVATLTRLGSPAAH